MPGVLGGGAESLRKAEAVPPASTPWNMMSPRRINRRDLSRLYDMDPVPEYIYDAIMRADNGDATKEEVMILDSYISEKKREIRRMKEHLGIEGSGVSVTIGRAAENILSNPYKLYKEREEDDDE